MDMYKYTQIANKIAQINDKTVQNMNILFTFYSINKTIVSCLFQGAGQCTQTYGDDDKRNCIDQQ